jgi:hypothetical protein
MRCPQRVAPAAAGRLCRLIYAPAAIVFAFGPERDWHFPGEADSPAGDTPATTAITGFDAPGYNRSLAFAKATARQVDYSGVRESGEGAEWGEPAVSDWDAA